tara:strand:- start:18 stop:674 length:657 start_codon:yes stop_codon:yes gene_type:complete
MKIILEGTSSSGKSSIVKLFPDNYTKIAMDDLENNREEMFKKIKNRYYKTEETDKIFVDIMDKRLSSKVKNKKKFIIDTVNMNGYPTIQKYLPKDTLKVLLYTNLKDLVRNIDKRKTYDSRGLYVFNQFTNYFEKTDKIEYAIDKIKLSDFIKYLKNIKYFFESEKDLKEYAKSIFEKMNIKDNKVHYIKPRYDGFDIILRTADKTSKELKNLLINLK